MTKVVVLVPDVEGNFQVPEFKTHAVHCLRSGVPNSVPDSRALKSDGQLAYNYADDALYVRRGNKVVKYTKHSEEALVVPLPDYDKPS